VWGIVDAAIGREHQSAPAAVAVRSDNDTPLRSWSLERAPVVFPA